MNGATDELAYLAGGGEMGALMRGHDWSGSPLGSPAQWPTPLRTVVRLMLNTGHPMYVFWGPQLACLYNDAYRLSIGPERHPSSLGQPARAVWDEIWPIIGPQIDQVMAGRGATWHENALVPITRNGKREDVYWTYSYGPIDDESAPHGVGGVLVVCTETTAHVLAEQRQVVETQRQELLLRLLNSQRHSDDPDAMMATAAQALGQYLGVNRVGFSEISDADTLHLGVTWSDGVLPPRQSQRSTGYVGAQYLAEMRAGRTIAVDDTTTDPLTQDSGFVADGVRANIGVAIVRFGRWHSGLYVNSATVRHWTPDEIALVRDVAELTWDAIERARAVIGLRDSALALRDSEQRLRLATEAAEIGLWDVDVGSNILFWPARVQAFLGISADRRVALEDFFVALHVDDQAPVRAAFAAALDPVARPLYDVEYRMLDQRDGSLRWVAAKGRAVFDADGVCRRVIGTAIDITQRKRNEERLHELNETLERRVADALAERKVMADIVETTDTFVQVIDTRYRWLAINRAAMAEFDRLFGLQPKPGDSLPKTLGAQQQHLEMMRRHWARALAGEQFSLTATVHSAQNEERFYDMRFNPLYDRDGAVIGAYQFCVDVTDRLHDQARLAEAEEHLRQAQKIEAIGQLTGGVAHDFNNLLMVISGGLSLLEKSTDPERRRMVVDGMREAVQRGAALSRQLLGFARRRALNPEPVDLARRIEGMRELLDRSLQGDVTVQTRFAAKLWPAKVDPAEFELALLNLCVNARDAMPQGGTIVVAADNAPDLQHRTLSGDFVRLSVADQGTGMSAEVLARVFEPFFTTKDVGKGSGLGLPQVYGFAQQSGGTVEIQSSPGHGTTITLLLPRSMVEPAAPSLHAALPPRTPDSATASAVLLVEDDDEVAALVAEMLQQLGYRVTRVASAGAALGALANERSIDVVFSDVMMPGGMNGLELAREIRRRRPGLPILLTSGYPESAQGYSELEKIELLAKPYGIEQLSAALDRVMADITRAAQ